MSGTVIDALTFWARMKPEHTAINFQGETISYRELESWADGVAHDLRARGVDPGDRVSLLGVNSLEWAVAALGAWKIGAIVAPFNNRMVATELKALVAKCEPTVVYVDDELRTRLEESRSDHEFSIASLQTDVKPLRGGDHEKFPTPVVDLDTATAIVFTSGTTGQPKGVIFTHATIAGEMHEWAMIEPIQPNSLRPLLVLPLFTAAGIIWGIARTVLHGGSLFLEPGFDPARALEVLTTGGANVLTGPPILFEQISKSPGFTEADLSHMVSAHCGGARVPVDLLHKWLDQGAALRQIYGQTEIGGSATATPRDEAAKYPEKCGWGGIFTKIRVVDPFGEDLPPGESGQILLRGPGMTPGYWNDPEATAATIVDGWLHTGDLGSLDENGYLTFIDRLKDIIISGGLNIAPAEIETVIAQIPGVDEVAVIPVPDAKFGETPAAIVKSSTVSEKEIVDHCSANLADYKVPRYVVLVEEDLPRMPSGKIAKRDVRASYGDIADGLAKVR